MLLLWHGTGRCNPLKKVGVASVILLLLLGHCILGLCGKFLEKPSVNFALIELVCAVAAVFGRASRLNL